MTFERAIVVAVGYVYVSVSVVSDGECEGEGGLSSRYGVAFAPSRGGQWDTALSVRPPGSGRGS